MIDGQENSNYERKNMHYITATIIGCFVWLFIPMFAWAQLPNNIKVSRTEKSDSVIISQRNWPNNSVNDIESNFESGFVKMGTRILEDRMVSLEVFAQWTDLEGHNNIIHVNLQYIGAGDWSIEIPQPYKSAEVDSLKVWKEKTQKQEGVTLDSLK